MHARLTAALPLDAATSVVRPATAAPLASASLITARLTLQGTHQTSMSQTATGREMGMHAGALKEEGRNKSRSGGRTMWHI
eukprot:363764-Chlamydomonas_euryale.AAC.1